LLFFCEGGGIQDWPWPMIILPHAWLGITVMTIMPGLSVEMGSH
jgi:hypothetical protein